MLLTIIFCNFAVLDVSFAVNSSLNRGFYIYICSFITLLQLYVIQSTWYLVLTIFEVLL